MLSQLSPARSVYDRARALAAGRHAPGGAMPDEAEAPGLLALKGSMKARACSSGRCRTGAAQAVAMAEGPERGLELVERIDLPDYHLLHAARADLLRRLDRSKEAAAYRDALALEMNAADRTFLERRLADVT